MLSQAITLVESEKEEAFEKGQELVERCLPHAGDSIRVGVTGVPGVGKSTFIEALGTYLTGQKKKVAVLAIDPSSESSGGSILGDKTRMEKLSNDPGAFIRPSPATGSLGGVARKTREAIILCEAAGFDHVLIETVGVGQSETTVHSMVDFFLLLMLAGAGDELQGIKRGIMEMADLIAINKADGGHMKEALAAKKEYQNAVHLFPPAPSEWMPKVEVCSGLEEEGIDTVWGRVLEYVQTTQENGYFLANRKEQARYWMHQAIEDLLKHDLFSDTKVRDSLPGTERKVMEGEMSSFQAARELLALYKKR